MRLDRAVANEGWCEQHRGAEVFVLVARASDHNPIQIMFEKNGANAWRWKTEFQVRR